MTYQTIGELVQYFKTTPRTLRVYEKVGITGPVIHEPKGKTIVRLYDEQNIQRLDVAFHLTHYGVELKVIADLLNSPLSEFSERYDDMLRIRRDAIIYDIAERENALFDLEGEMAARGVK